MSTFCNTMANILVYSLLILFANKLAVGDPCTKVDSLHLHNIKNCQIYISSNKTDEKIGYIMKNDKKTLLKIKLNFPENTQKAIRIKQLESERKNIKGASFFYVPFNWQLLIAPVGKELLSLAPNFQTLSLNTLTIGVEDLNTNVFERPPGCLGNVTHHEYLYMVKEYFIHSIQKTGNKYVMICTPTMKNIDGKAKFHPTCYGTEKKNGSRTCQYVNKGPWTHGLNIFVYTIKTIIMLFVPILIPASIYTSKYVYSSYRVLLDEKIPIKVMVSKEKLLKDDTNWKFSLPMSYFKNWDSFNPEDLEEGVAYNFAVTSLNLGVRANALVSKAHVPASLADLIREKFYLCKIGDEDSFRWCCYSSILPKHMQSQRSSTNHCMSWMKCCRGFMKVILILLIPQPWIIRLMVYYYSERITFNTRRKAADDQGLSMTFKGYLLGYISPMHWFFLTCYILYIIDSILFGILAKNIRRELVKILKESFRDMHASMSFEILRWGASRYLVPFNYFGIFGFLVAPLYWVLITPFVLILFCVYYIPLVSFFFRLTLHLIWFCLPNFAIHSKYFYFCKKYVQRSQSISEHLKIKKISENREKTKTYKEERNCVYCLFQILSAFLCLISVAGIAILGTECIGYLIDIVAFTLTGMIIHTTAVLPYFSFVFMIVIYLSTSINDVRITYVDFNKSIVSEIISAANINLKIGTRWTDTAHFIKRDDSAPPVSRLTFGKSGTIYFQATSLLLFINEEDHGHIPKEFFYRTCGMPDSTSPGSRAVNYCKALIKFMYVFLFLLFVLLVVLSFGGVYNISSTHQMFAALAGGIVPYILQKVVKLNPKPEQLDTSTLSFKTHFWTEIQNFRESYKVRDFQVELLSKEESTNSDASNRELDPEHTVIDILTKTSVGDDERNLDSYVYFDGSFQLDFSSTI